MKREPPGMKGTQYGSGWVFSNSSALPSCIVMTRSSVDVSNGTDDKSKEPI
jgi:hypothetical protein